MRFQLKDERRAVELIQVTRHLREEDPRQFRREVGSLVRASKELRCRRAILITMDQEGLMEDRELR